MNYSKVVAIISISQDVLEKVERRLQELQVPGISVTKVKGYGEYASFYSRDWMTTHTRVEIFTRAERAELIAQAIVEAAHTGLPGDGMVAIQPVAKVFRIRRKAEARPDEI